MPAGNAHPVMDVDDWQGAAAVMVM